MKDYTSSEPAFSPSIQIIETTDPGHADIINAATKQLLQNTLVLYAHMEEICNEDNMVNSFYQVFPLAGDSLTSADIDEAINTLWNGESSADETALSAEDVDEAINTPWNGESSADETALSAEDINEVTTMH